jgi:RNA polymerase sigma-70 factor (ECF subfamily)
MPDAARQKMAVFVDLFRTGDFDTIRAMLANDVKLELVNRLKWEGRDKIAPYFTRYAEETRWRFAFGAVEGRPAMLVFERGAIETPAYFVLVDWRNDKISAIRDFLFAPYAAEAMDWVRLG